MQELLFFVNKIPKNMVLLNNIFQAAYFLLPVWIVNIALVFCGYFRRQGLLPDRPIDFGKNFLDGKRLTGESITFYGLLASVFFGFFVGSAQQRPYMGVVLGLGGWLGNALGSFIKRRLGFAQGDFVPLLDHVDYVAGAFLLCRATGYLVPRHVIIYGVLLTLIFHPLVCLLGFKAGFKEKPW